MLNRINVKKTKYEYYFAIHAKQLKSFSRYYLISWAATFYKCHFIRNMWEWVDVNTYGIKQYTIVWYISVCKSFQTYTKFSKVFTYNLSFSQIFSSLALVCDCKTDTYWLFRKTLCKMNLKCSNWCLYGILDDIYKIQILFRNNEQLDRMKSFKNKNVYLGDVKASDKADKVSRFEAAS